MQKPDLSGISVGVGGVGKAPPHVRFGIPSYSGRPSDQTLEMLEAAEPLLKAKGWEVSVDFMAGNCYVQNARNEIAARFFASGATDLFFIDDDVGAPAEAVLRVLETPGDVVCGVYPKKQDELDFPVVLNTDKDGYPLCRDDGMLSVSHAPAGFLRIKRFAIAKLRAFYQAHAYDNYDDKGQWVSEAYDLFPQGVRKRRWWGEDFGFCELWTGIKGEIWGVPDIDFVHVGRKTPARPDGLYRGNYHQYLLNRPRHDATSVAAAA